MWHLRFGHIGKDKVNKLVKDGILDSFNSQSTQFVNPAFKKKMIKLSLVGYRERAMELLALVHTDMCGPFDVQIDGGYYYFITFIDDFLWYGYVFLMRHKSKTFEKFKEFKNKIKK